MDLKRRIMKTLEMRRTIRASEVVRTTGFSRAYVNRFFQELRDEGRIVLIGKANRAHYVLANQRAIRRARNVIRDIALELKNKGIQEDRVLDQIKKKTGIFAGLRKNTSDVLAYAFSEMLNNAIEHSHSKVIRTTMRADRDHVTFSVTDEGIGIFKNIIRKKKLRNVMEAIQDLLKGKQTTMPAMHSGEGIFFTSKAADILVIQGSNKKLIFDNLLEDVFIKDIKPIAGTKVNFSIDRHSTRRLPDIFRQYTDASFKFSKTAVTVRLFRAGSEYVSRSQARRLAAGLDKFQTIILDFKGIDTIGQGFADEIFRVWSADHPEIVIEVRNANENVRFMIARATPK